MDAFIEVVRKTILSTPQTAIRSIVNHAGLWCLGFSLAVLFHLAPFSIFFTSGSSHAVPLSASSRGVLSLDRETTDRTSPSLTGFEWIERGRSRYDATNYAAAAHALQQAAIAFDAEHLPLNHALALSYLALTYNRLGDRNAAQATIQASHIILADQQGRLSSSSSTPSNSAHSSLHAVQAQVSNASGHLHLTWGNYRDALEDWQEAETHYRILDDQVGQIGSTINQAQAMQSMGRIAQANQLLKKCAKELDDPKIDADVRAIGRWQLGTTYRLIGNLPESQSELEKSLSIISDHQRISIQNEVELDLAHTYRAMAKRAIAIGQHDAALNPLRRALQIYNKIGQHPSLGDADGDRPSATLVKAQLNELSLTLDLQDWSQSSSTPSTPPEWTTLIFPSRIQHLSQSLSTTLPQRPLNRDTLYARLNFVHSLIRQLALRSAENAEHELSGHQLKEVAIARRIIKIYQDARNLQDARAESLALGRLGTFYEQQKKWSNAHVLTHRALSISQTIYADELNYQWQWQLGRILTGREDYQKALESYQKSVTSLGMIRGNLRFVDADIQFSFRDSVEPVYREYLDLLLRTEHNLTPSTDRLERAVQTVNDLQLSELENYLSCSLSDETHQIEAVQHRQSFEAIQNLAQIDSSAAILHPILLTDRLAVILELPSAEPMLVFSEIDQPLGDVEVVLKRLRKNLSVAPDRTPQVREDAQKVYRWLIDPFQAELDQFPIDTLVFVLDGALRNIPMAVLFDGERYLIERYAIAIAPQLELLQPEPFNVSRGVFTAGIGTSQAIEGRQFSKIEYLVPELEGIRQLNGSGPTLLGDDFTKENLEDRLSSEQFSAIHIKTHGVFSSDPNETFIVASEELIRSWELGNLIQLSIRQNAAPIDLLVLSACSTAKGDNRAVLGLAGVAAQAGVKSTVSTLWDAQDKPNTDLMLMFHRHLKDGSSRAAALRQAQLHLIEIGYFEPFFWAPYVLVGSWL